MKPGIFSSWAELFIWLMYLVGTFTIVLIVMNLWL